MTVNNSSGIDTDIDLALSRPSQMAITLLYEDKIAYYIIGSLITTNAIVLNIFVMIGSIRLAKRRTVLNYLIYVGRFVSLGSLIHIFFILFENSLLCLSVYLIFPAFVMFEKLLQTAQCFCRHVYVYSERCYQTFLLTCTVYINLAVIIIVGAIPFFTLFEFNPTPYVLCTQGSADDKPMAYRFLFFYNVVVINSICIDVICYVRILHFIRTSSVRVAVVATTSGERQKGKNLITAPSSLLIWLVVIVFMIPSSILHLRGTPHSPVEGAADTVTLINFQICLLFVLTNLLPLLYIGSSADLREDVGRFTHAILIFLGLRDKDDPRGLRFSQSRLEIYLLNQGMPP